MYFSDLFRTFQELDKWWMISYLEKILSRMYRKKGGNPYEINFEYIVKCIGQDTPVVSMKNVKKRKEVEELRLLL